MARKIFEYYAPSAGLHDPGRVPIQCQLTCESLGSWPWPQITQAGQDGSQCGIGVVFRMDNHGALVVDSLVPGGPAWESSTQGGLQVSDVLQTVDGKNVYRCFHIPETFVSSALCVIPCSLSACLARRPLRRCRRYVSVFRLCLVRIPHTIGQ